MGSTSRHATLIACSLVVAATAACGAFLDLSGDAPAPDRGDGGDDAAPLDGTAVSDASAVDACAEPASCAPELLTTLEGSIQRLVAADDALYVAKVGAVSGVYRVGKVPPGVTLDLDPAAHGSVVDAFRGDSNLAVEPGGAVYWGTPNGLRRREADAGVASLPELGAPVSGARIAGGRLYFTVNGPAGVSAPNKGHVASCALPGCTDVQASYTQTAYPLDVVPVAGGALWWLGTNEQGMTLTLRSLAFSLPAEQRQPSRLVTDGARIFWSTIDGLSMFTVAGNQLSELMPAPTVGADRVNGIALDDDGTLYVTQQSAVKRCTISGGKCTFTTVATNASTAIDVAVDAAFVYWGTADGAITRLRKRP